MKKVVFCVMLLSLSACSGFGGQGNHPSTQFDYSVRYDVYGYSSDYGDNGASRPKPPKRKPSRPPKTRPPRRMR